jgi:hypothetical protein
MKAELRLWERHVLSETAFAELVVWRLPRSLRGSAHPFKYRLAYVVDGTCVLRFDNEAGKGDHMHMGNVESPYAFISPERLVADFWAEVDRWNGAK